MTTAGFHAEPIQRRKLSEEISLRIQEFILDEHIPPGDSLPSERELMQMFGVGRTSIREAFALLSQMGLVEIKNGERARVARPSAATIVGGLVAPVRSFLKQPGALEELRGARGMFETMLVRHAATNASGEDLEFLRAALEKNKAAVGDLDAFVTTDIAFHLAIATLSRNSIFPALYEAMTSWLAEQRVVSLRAAGAEAAAFRAHHAIYDAVASGDPDAAEKAMLAHLKEVEHFYESSSDETTR